jgi:hypothetical protein
MEYKLPFEKFFFSNSIDMVNFLPEVEPMTQEEDLLEVSSETLVLQDQVLGLEQDEVAEVVAVVVDLVEVVLDEAWVRSGVWLRIGLCVLNFLSILSDYLSQEKRTQK